MKEGLMLAKEFFRSISSGTRTGVLKFRNGEEAFIDSKCLRTNMVGNIYTVKIQLGFSDHIELKFDDDWKHLNLQPGELSDWDVVSARFDDMAYKVEQIAEGKLKGYFYNTLGERLTANSDTVKLCTFYQTTRRFTIMGPKNIAMYYTAPLCSDVCEHGQLASWNLIDFIEETD